MCLLKALERFCDSILESRTGLADFIFESTIYRKWYEKAGLEAFEMENAIFEGRYLGR